MVGYNFRDLRIITGIVRFHYVNIFEAKEPLSGGNSRYSICLIIPKDDGKTIDKINRAIEAAIKSGEELWAGHNLKDIKVPLRDGDTEKIDKPEFAGCYFLNASSRYMPEVVDENYFAIINPDEVYPGCY